jgi:hypothetical protein
MARNTNHPAPIPAWMLLGSSAPALRDRPAPQPQSRGLLAALGLKR